MSGMTPLAWALWFAWGAFSSAAITLSVDPGNALWGSKLFAICALLALLADLWRRRGKKLADRGLGVVRDLGHRLAVVPIGGWR